MQIENAVAVFEGDAETAAHVEMARAVRSHFLGDVALAQSQIASAAARFEEAGDIRMACTQRVNVGFALLELGAYALAERELTNALVTAERLGLTAIAVAARHNLGFVLGRLGQLDAAVQMEEQAVEAYRQQGDPRMEASSRLYLARILLQAGALDRAASEARRALGICTNLFPARARCLATLAQVRLAQSRWAEARDVAAEAQSLLDAVGGVDGDEQLIRLAFAEAAWTSGDHEAAMAAISVAQTRLLDRAARIGDLDLRTCFLQGVPENARTLFCAEQWLGR
jgi:tetratricopeptide (TPR) repeat protein